MTKRVHHEKLVGMLVISFLIISLFTPFVSFLSENNIDEVKAENMTLNSEENDWIITSKTYLNGTENNREFERDSNIIIGENGELHINNATLSLLIDGEGHTWNITVKDGGVLKLWNSTLRTKTRSTQLRPFIKTDVTAKNGSQILLKSNSFFRFPGFVNIYNSLLNMDNSTFDKLKDVPQYDYLWDGSGNDDDLDLDDNDDCPRLKVTGDSKFLMESSEINNYYENEDSEYPNEMEWYPMDPATGEILDESFEDEDSEYYDIEGGSSLDVEEWYLSNPIVPEEFLGEYPYIDPINRISSLYVEITYKTKENYTGDDNLQYWSPEEDDWVTATTLPYSADNNKKDSDIWEVDLTDFDLKSYDSTSRLVKDLNVTLTNTHTDDNSTIQVDELKLISAYENDIYIEDSEITIIDSYMDVDFLNSDTDPRDESTEKTTNETWREDSRTEHSVLRMRNTNFKSYGLTVSPEEPSGGIQYGDPCLVNDATSKNNTWIYRWLTVQVLNEQGVPLPGATLTAAPENYGSEDLENLVIEKNDLYNNKDAWSYLNKTGHGYYDTVNDTYVADENGEVTLFLTSDRINQPEDWPNSKFVGNYMLDVNYSDESQDIYEEYSHSISFSAFPAMNESANHKYYDFEMDVPLPDLASNDSDLRLLSNGDEPNFISVGDTIDANLTVHNIGGWKAENFDVSFYINEYKNDNLLDTITIDSMESLENISVETQWTPDSEGQYTIIAVVDPNNNILELNETNNIARKDILVGNKPDLLVDSIFIEPSDNVLNSTTLNISARVGNIGGSDASDVNVSFLYNSSVNPTYQLITYDFVDIAGNDTYLTTSGFEWDYPGIGNYTIKVVVDPNDVIDEMNETNNEKTRKADVYSYPDLTISDQISFKENGEVVNRVVNGTKIDIEVPVSNVGGIEANNVNVSIYLNVVSENSLMNTTYISSLDPGEDIVTPFSWDVDVPGDYNIIAVVDPNDEIQELNEDNNTGESQLIVDEKPDLTVQNINSDQGFDIMNNTSINLTADIGNLGGSDVTDVEVRFTAEGETTYEIGSVRVDVPGNSSIIQTPVVTWEDPTTGTYEILVEVDPDDEFDELNEDNNNLSRTLTVESEPDLTPIDFTISEQMIVEDDMLYISTKIKNQGGWTAEDVNVSFYVDRGTDSEAHIETFTIDSISPDTESNIISTQWQANISIERLKQIRTISVYIYDDDEVITDNNEAEEDVTIHTQSELYFDSENTTYSPDNLIQKGQEVNFSIEVMNSGGWNGTAEVSLLDGDTIINQTYLEIDSATIDNPSRLRTNLSWTPASRGFHDISLEISRGGDAEDKMSWNVPIFSEDYEYDVIVDGNDTKTITDEYVSTGFVVVEDNGTLTLGGASRTTLFRMRMERDNQYGIIVRDAGRLVIDNTQIYPDEANHEFEINVIDDGELTVKENTNIQGGVNIRSIGENSPVVRFNDSEVAGDVEIIGGDLYIDNSQFTSENIKLNPNWIFARNSTFEAPLDDFVDTNGKLVGITTPPVGEDRIKVSGQGRIEIHRWLRVNAESNASHPLEGAEITISSNDRNYTRSGYTNEEGYVYLSALTDIVMSDDIPFVGNYEIRGNYSEEGSMVYSYGPIMKSLSSYPSGETEETLTLTFEDVRFPDLALDDDDISFSQQEITAGNDLYIHANIENQGVGTARDIEVMFYVMDENQEYTYLGSETINELEPAGSQTVTYTWTTEMTNESLLEESRGIKVEINPDVDPLDDINPSNDFATSSVLIRSPPNFEFSQDMELLLDGTSYEEKTINEMDVLTIKTQILNSGGTDVKNASLEIATNDITIKRETIDLNSMGTYNLTFDWEVNVTGSQTISISIQSSMDDPQYSNTISKNAQIEPVEIHFRDITLPEKPKTNQEVSISGVVVNDEGKSLEGIRVNGYLINDKGNRKTPTKTAVTNDNGYFMMTFKTPDDGGKYKVMLEPEIEGTEPVQSDESFNVEGEEFPWWIVFAVVIIAIIGVVFVLVYLKFFGEGEYVECGNCGATIPADSTKCPECGVEFDTDTVKCSECGEWIPADADFCPECGAEFIKTGEEVEEYTERMRAQYKKYRDKFRRKAEDEMGREMTNEEFMEWWKEQPSYLTFDEWLEREETKRKEGSIECPECGALNSADDAVCQKCGSTLIEIEEEPEEEEETTEEEGFEEITAEEGMFEKEEEEEIEEEPEEKKEEEKSKKIKKVRRVKKQPKKKRVKKKVVKKPSEKEEGKEESE